MEIVVSENIFYFLKNIYNKLKDYSFVIKPLYYVYNEDSNTYIMTFNKLDNFAILNNWLKRDLYLNKKYLEICLKNLHKNKIFFYYNNSKIKCNNSSLYLYDFFNCLIIQNENIEIIKNYFGKKSINNNNISFMLFYIHYLCFSLMSENTFHNFDKTNVENLFQNNKVYFQLWEKKEIYEIERYFKNTRNFEEIWNIIYSEELWKCWDIYILNASLKNLNTIEH